MTRLAVALDRSGRHALVVQGRHRTAPRRRVLGISGMFADALLDRGVALWSHRASTACGRPGLVVFDEGADARAELRADVADPTTVVATGVMTADDARACLTEDGPVAIGAAGQSRVDASPSFR